MAVVTWQGRIAAALTEQDVVGVARDFVAALEPRDIASLPEECRPGKIVDSNDVTGYAFLLVRTQCADAGAAGLMWKLADFFSKASIRLSQILAVVAEEPDSRRSA